MTGINKKYKFEFPVTITGDTKGLNQYQILQRNITQNDDMWCHFINGYFAFNIDNFNWKVFKTTVTTHLTDKHHGVISIHIIDKRTADQVADNEAVTLDIIKQLLHYRPAAIKLVGDVCHNADPDLHVDMFVDFFDGFHSQLTPKQAQLLQNVGR